MVTGKVDTTRTLHAYVCGVLVAGVLLFAYYLATGDQGVHSDSGLLQFWLFLLPLFVCEAMPIGVVNDGVVDEIVVSTTFTFALLLAFGPVPAMTAQGVASVIADLSRKKGLLKTAFNLGQNWVAWGLAAVPLALLHGGPQFKGAGPSAWASLLAVVASALVYFALNATLVGVVIAIYGGVPLLESLESAFRYHCRSNLLLLAIGPVFLVVAEQNPLLYPLVLFAVLAAYRGAAVSVERDYQASHDSLTGLPNRALFNRRFDDLLARAQRSGLMVAVLLIDLDRFKEVNDTLGHRAGDALLKEVGPRIAETLEADGTIARLGGDEFGVLLADVRGASHALARASAIVEALERPFTVDDGLLDVEASIGVALFPDHGGSKEALLQRADIAMYVAKSEQHAVELYSTANDHYSRRRLGLLADLRTALRSGELRLHYQPKVDLASGEIDSVEALVRWQHPVYGLLSPNEFVPLAERSGLIRPLTSFVCKEALEQSARWRDAGLDVAVSVNLSVRNLHDQRLPAEVLDLLARHHLPPRALQIEITESSIMSDPARAAQVLNALDRTGIRLAVDDFGTGYSSLAYLQRLPVSEIKIDRSFVSGMADSAADRVIVRSTIDLARNLGLTVTAEGVETMQVLRLLREAGCHSAQGYLISRPVPADELGSLLSGPAWTGSAASAGQLLGEPVIDLGGEPVLDLAAELEPGLVHGPVAVPANLASAQILRGIDPC